MLRARLLPALLTTLTVATAGCASSGKPAPTKPQYLTQANAVCKAANAKLVSSAVRAFADGNTSEARVEQYAKASAFPTLERLVGDLRALAPPKGDEAAVGGIYDALQGAVDKTKADPRLLTASAGTDPFRAANQKANAYGLRACGPGA